MVKVRVKDFQSISDAQIDIDGFTVVIGKNNLGKSALVRAIDAALTNRTGNEFIQWGKKETQVSLKKDDLNVLWEKGDSATYKINEKSYSKLNRAVPPPIIEAGFRKIEIGDLKLTPLVAPQFEELFLLDKPGSVITEALSVIYKLNVLSDADSLCQKEVRTTKSLLKTRDSDLQKTKNELVKYEGLGTIKKGIEKIRSLEEQTESLKKEIETIKYYLTELQEQSEKVKNLEKITGITIPGIKDTEKIYRDYQWLPDVLEEYETLSRRIKSLEGIKSITIPDYKEQQAMLKGTQEISGLTEELKTLVQSINSQKELLAHLKDAGNFIDTLDGIRHMVDSVSYLRTTTGIFMDSVDTIKTCKNQMQKTTESLDSALAEKVEWKVCPTCERPF